MSKRGKNMKDENIALKARVAELESKQIVVSGYSESQLAQNQRQYLQTGYEIADEQITGFYQGKLIPYLYVATALYILREKIAAFIMHPRSTDDDNIAFLQTRFENDGGEQVTFLQAFEERLLGTQKTELALEPDREHPENEYNFLNESALIHQELIKFENAVKDNHRKRQIAAIEAIKQLLTRTPSKTIDRQIKMRVERNLGGSDSNTTIDEICQWAKPLYMEGCSIKNIWQAAKGHFEQIGDYAAKKQFEQWDKNFDGENNLAKNLNRRYRR
jgi:hypothetical protein